MTLAQTDREACAIYEQFGSPNETLFAELARLDEVLGNRIKKARSMMEFRAAKQAFLLSFKRLCQTQRSG